MNIEEFKSKFLNFFIENNKYSYLLGSQELISSKKVNVEVILPNADNFEDIFVCLLYFIELEILEHISYRKADINAPLLKHQNIKYITNNIDLYNIDPDYINYNPFINNELVYINIENPLSDIENHIQDIKITNNKITWTIPIYK